MFEDATAVLRFQSGRAADMQCSTHGMPTFLPAPLLSLPNTKPKEAVWAV